jgi:hypothetical protein
MKDSGFLILVLIRIVTRLGPLLVLPGCAESDSPSPREVPITRSSRPPSDIETPAATKAPRAIATH